MNRSLKIVLSILIVAGLSALGLWGYWSFLAPVPESTTPPAPNGLQENHLQLVSAEAKVKPARQALLSFVQGGRVAEVLVSTGQAVRRGEALARQESESLRAALKQAEAALQAAQATLQTAETQFEMAQTAAHAAEAQARSTRWRARPPSEIEQPVWYFDSEQEYAAAQAALENASAELQLANDNLNEVLRKASSADLLAAERRLAQAQAAFLAARQVWEQSKASPDRILRDQAQKNYDWAKNELQAAQAYYDQILTTQAAQDVLEARAQAAIAQEIYDVSQDRLAALQTGERSFQVRAAQDAVEQAQAAVLQAQAAVETAQVALKQATLAAEFDGVIVQVNVEAGEVIAPGTPLIVLADLTQWQVETIDLAEADIVHLKIGMPARISLDAFPGRVFAGQIVQIGYLGEDRRGNVTYPVTLSLQAEAAQVYWGMTAFVEIDLE
jgi:multidrug resistance efflux pump